MTKNLYAVLGLEKGCSQDEIKKAFRKLAIKYHPDKASDEEKFKKEELFKEVNEAYTILSDPEKRSNYDKFGTCNGPTPGPDMHDIFSDMFRGGMHPGMETFRAGMHGQAGQSFKMFFGNGQAPQADVTEVKVSLTDIRNGVTKKVSYEVLDKCDTCSGIGAKTASDIIRCMSCNGNGTIPQQLGPFMVQQGCPSCGGRGQIVKDNRQCLYCKGERVMYTTRTFDLRIPQGVPNQHIHRMEGKGSFDLNHNCNNDRILVFVHDVDPRYRVDYEKNNVHMEIEIKLEELLCGFVKVVQVYDESFSIYSKSYFNPTKDVVIEKKGLPFYKRKDMYGNLVIHFKVVYPNDNDLAQKFSKYRSIFMSMFKRKEYTIPSGAIDINPQASQLATTV